MTEKKTDLQPIQIDFEVFQKIQQARKDFSDTENQVLRRLLGIDHRSISPAPMDDSQNQKEPIPPSDSLDDFKTLEEAISPFFEQHWQKNGVTLPHGTQLRMTYEGRLYQGEIQVGAWLVKGYETPFTSPSAAASAIARKCDNGKTALNGWLYWEALRPGDKSWRRLHTLRTKQPTRSRKPAI